MRKSRFKRRENQKETAVDKKQYHGQNKMPKSPACNYFHIHEAIAEDEVPH